MAKAKKDEEREVDFGGFFYDDDTLYVTHVQVIAVSHPPSGEPTAVTTTLAVGLDGHAEWKPELEDVTNVSMQPMQFGFPFGASTACLASMGHFIRRSDGRTRGPGIVVNEIACTYMLQREILRRGRSKPMKVVRG